MACYVIGEEGRRVKGVEGSDSCRRGPAKQDRCNMSPAPVFVTVLGFIPNIGEGG